MVTVVGSLLFLAVLVFVTVRFVQWLRGTGPFDRNPLLGEGVGEARRALRDEIAQGRGHDDPPLESTDLNDAWMAGEGFGRSGDEGEDRRR